VANNIVLRTVFGDALPKPLRFKSTAV